MLGMVEIESIMSLLRAGVKTLPFLTGSTCFKREFVSKFGFPSEVIQAVRRWIDRKIWINFLK